MHSPYKVRPYRPGDVLAMPNPVYEPLGAGEPHELEKLAQASYTFTVLKEGNVIAIGGSAHQWKRCHYAWVVVDERARGEGRRILSVGQQILRHILTSMSLRRINCIVDGSISGNVKFVEMLGFKYEYTMKNAGPKGHDVYGFYLDREDKK